MIHRAAEGDEFLRRLYARVNQLLSENASRIPVTLLIDGWFDNSGQMAGAIWVRLRCKDEIRAIHDCSEVFIQMARVLTEELGAEAGSSIAIDAPPQLLGAKAVLKDFENSREIDLNRGIRRKGSNHG